MRSVACVLLRKAVGAHWAQTPAATQAALEAACLGALGAARDPPLRRGVLELTAEVAAATVPHGAWPALLAHLGAALQPPAPPSDAAAPEPRATALALLAALADTLLTAPATRAHAPALFALVCRALDPAAPYAVRAAAATALAAFMPHWDALTHAAPSQGAAGAGTAGAPEQTSSSERETAVAEVFRGEVLPALFALVEAAVGAGDTATVAAVFETLQALAELPVRALGACVPALAGAALALGGNAALDFDVRAMALALAATVARAHARWVARTCVAPVVALLARVAAEPACNAYYDDDDDAAAPRALAATLLAEVADAVGARPVYAAAAPILSELFSSGDCNEEVAEEVVCARKRAGLLLVAALCEACNEEMRGALGALVRAVLATLAAHPALAVAALLALHQLAHFCAPDIRAHRAALLPALLALLAAPDARVQRRAAAVLEILLAGLAPGALAPADVPRLAAPLLALAEAPLTPAGASASAASSPSGGTARDMAFACLASLAAGAGRAYLPLVPRTLAAARAVLASAGCDETMLARGRALETVAVLARTLGADAFAPHLGATVATALRALEEDGAYAYELQEMLCGVLASLAELYGPRFAPYIRDVLPYAMGIAENDDGDDNDEDQDEQEEEDEDEEEEDAGLVRCKAAALRLMGVLARATREHFAAFVPTLDAETAPYLAAADAELRSCALYARVCALEACTAARAPAAPAYLRALVAHALRLVAHDPSVTVVDTAVQGLAVLARTAGLAALAPYAERVTAALLTLLRRRAPCQRSLTDVADDDEEDEVEEEDVDNSSRSSKDSKDEGNDGEGSGWPDGEVDLCESLFELLTVLARMLDARRFGALHAALAPALAAMVRADSSHHVRAAAAACYGDFVRGGRVAGGVLLAGGAAPLLLRCLADPEPNVRQNACYSLGVVLESAGPAAWAAAAPPVLARLAPLVTALGTALGTAGTAADGDDDEQAALLRDNVAACVARVLSVAPPGVALGAAAAADVVRAWLALLPLRRDTAELAPVVRCLTALHRRDPADPRLGALPLFHEKYAASLAALLAVLSDSESSTPPAPATATGSSSDDDADSEAQRTAAATAAAREAAPVLRAMLQQNPALAPFIQTALPPAQQALLTQLLSSSTSSS